MTIAGAVYIGLVRHRGPTYATVEPMVESTPDGSAWSGSVKAPSSRFPTRGFVHWHEPPSEAKRGGLWQFHIEEHPFAQENGRPEHMQVANPIEAVEVIDLRAWESISDLQSVITSDGIELRPAPLGRRVMLWTRPDTCVGPVLLLQGDDRSRWIFDKPEGHQDAGRVSVWRVTPDLINAVTIEGERYFLSPQLSFGQPAGIQNWASDISVARGILGRLRKLDSATAKALNVTESVFRAYLDLVEVGQLASLDPTMERARAERLISIRRTILDDTTLLREAAEALLQTEQVQSELKQRVDVEQARLVETRQADIETSLKALRTEADAVGATLGERRAALAVVDEELASKRRELNEKVDGFERELATRLRELAKRPEALFAEVAILRAALASARQSPKVLSSSSASPPSTAAEAGTDTSTRISSLETLRAALMSSAMAARISPLAVLALHGAVLAGTVPVVVGLRAYDLLRAYCSVVAGSRIHWVPVASSMLEPRDLLGRFEPLSGRIIPERFGILDAAQDALRTGRLHMVVLDGFNRAPPEAYLLPILQSGEGGRCGDPTRRISVASPSLIIDDATYADVAHFSWPSSLLIACMSTEGAATLPVPTPLWQYLSVVYADDDRGLPSETGGLAGLAVATEAGPDEWLQWMANARNYSRHSSGAVATIASRLQVSTGGRDAARRMLEVLSANDLPDAVADGMAIGSILVPRATGSIKAIGDIISSSGASAPGWEAIFAEVEKLRL